MDLKSHQTEFVAALLGQENQIEKLIAAPSMQAKNFIERYRKSRTARFNKILQSTYPVCHALVGDNYFKQLAHFYQKEYLHDEPELTFYGKYFSAFLHSPNLHQNLVYLPDMARLEWACYQILQGSFIAGMEVNKLSEIPTKKQGLLKFTLGATHSLFTSPYPIAAIWQQHFKPPELHREIDLNEGPCEMLVYRSGWDLTLEPLSKSEYLFLSCIEQGMHFAKTWEQCDAVFPGLPFADLFAKAVRRGWITDVIYDARQN